MQPENHIDQVFNQLKANKQTALIPFLSIGDPDLDTSLDIIKAVEDAGADIVELGVPYSDPLADGPVIQQASGRALANGVTIRDCIELAGKARDEGVKLPFILFTYFNPVLQYGLDAFFTDLKKQGISGVIIPDLPFEEDDKVKEIGEAYGIHLIPLVAPTSQERIQKIVSRARGFIYCVSSLGVTGVRSNFHQGIEDFIQTVKEASDLPVAVGFGISRPEHVSRFSTLCDGVIVGSAIIRKVEENLQWFKQVETRDEALKKVRDYVADLKAGSEKGLVGNE